MKSAAIIGAQWGDEGKGKITDALCESFDVVVRYQGGNNAGHTIKSGGKTTILHIIPSGILHKNCVSVIAHGPVFDPENFINELKNLENNVQVTPNNLKISGQCPVITGHHKLIDSLRETQGPVKIGTTGRGIGPSYEDKVSRKSIKLQDLLNKDILYKKIKNQLTEKSVLFQNLYQVEFPSVEEETEKLFNLGKIIAPFICDTFNYLDKAGQQGKKILYEGAQGILLDMDYGTYPFVTSSNPSVGGIYCGAGVPYNQIDEVLGIAKAYTTRVGEGPFPTELDDEDGNKLQDVGQEFGATTGRRRRCGWLDLPLLKYAIKVSNLTSLAMTKLDVLTLDHFEKIKVCYAYKYKNETVDCAYPGINLNEVKPLYKELPAFSGTFDASRTNKELEQYIEVIEKETGIPVSMMSCGPDREQLVYRRPF